MNFFTVIFQGFLSVFKITVLFRTSVSNCVFMFIDFYFCWGIDFFLFLSFSGYFFFGCCCCWRNYIGLFENATVFSSVCGLPLRKCSLETWGRLPYFDKNGKTLICDFDLSQTEKEPAFPIKTFYDIG